MLQAKYIPTEEMKLVMYMHTQLSLGNEAGVISVLKAEFWYW